MSRTLFIVLSALRGPGLVRLLAGILIVLVLPLTLGIDLLTWLRRRALLRRVLAWRTALCDRKHSVELWGAWECHHCRLTFESRHGFAPCPHCAALASAVCCACGLPVLNPLYIPEDRS